MRLGLRLESKGCFAGRMWRTGLRGLPAPSGQTQVQEEGWEEGSLGTLHVGKGELGGEERQGLFRGRRGDTRPGLAFSPLPVGEVWALSPLEQRKQQTPDPQTPRPQVPRPPGPRRPDTPLMGLGGALAQVLPPGSFPGDPCPSRAAGPRPHRGAACPSPGPPPGPSSPGSEAWGLPFSPLPSPALL